MNVLRMEKGFKGAGELTNEVTLPEADVLRFVRDDRTFLGADKTFAQTPKWLCAYLEIEPDGLYDGTGGEALTHDGHVVGSVASVVYSPTVKRILAFAYLKPEAATPGTHLEVLIQGQPRSTKVLGQAAYDPDNLRPRTDA